MIHDGTPPGNKVIYGETIENLERSENLVGHKLGYGRLWQGMVMEEIASMSVWWWKLTG